MRLIDISVASYPPRFAAHRASYLTGMALGLTLLLAAHTQAATVSLAWNAVASSTGYKLYYGTQSKIYTTVVDVDSDTNCTVDIADPASPQTYYFAVTAVDSSRSIESGFSNEVSKLLQPTPPPSPLPPPSTPLPPGTPTGGPTITLEAEEMTLTKYLIENSTAASNEMLISRRDAGGAAPGGMAMQGFPGPQGTYRITVWYFDESDGQSTLTLKVNGMVVETWSANADLADGGPSTVSRTSRTMPTALLLDVDDPIVLEGIEQGGEYARFDKIDFVPVSSGTPPPPSTPLPPGTPTGGPTITLEAEEMTLTKYLIENSTAASDERLISRRDAGGAAGMAMQGFPGPQGTYRITVWYFDESDGQSTLTLKVNGMVVETWSANADLADGGPSTVSRTSRTMPTALLLDVDDPIVLEGIEQGGEYARFDKIDFVPVSSGPVAIAGRVAAYAFEAPSGTTASEASGNGTNGVLTNGAVFAVGKNGNGVSLDGANDYVNLGNPASLRLTGSMTLSAWINSSAFPFDDAAIISKRQSSHVGYQLDTTIDRGPLTIGFKISDASGNTVARYGATTLVANTWYHVAGVYDATNRTMNVYLNGQPDNGTLVGTIPAAQPDSNQNVNIGQRPGSPGTFNFKGLLDDVRIYNQALSALDIRTDMNTSP